MSQNSQWLTEKHYLVCPKGVMFKQMKVNSQQTTRFSGHLAATSLDTMIGNAFMCMGNLAVAAPPVSALQAKAVAVMASPGLGLPRMGIPPQLLAFASSIGTMKCNLASATRQWVNASSRLNIQGHPALVVGKSMMLCPSEAAAIETKETFWEAVSAKSANVITHIAAFSFSLLAARGLGTRMDTAKAGGQNLELLGGQLNLLSRLSSGHSFTHTGNVSSAQEQDMTKQSSASGAVEISLSLFAAKGETLTCFPAGTLVHTDHGLLPIERITVGERVWTRNEVTQDRELKTVLATFKRTALKMITLELESGAIFELTSDHECFCNGKWITAQTLAVGDSLENIVGDPLPISNITVSRRISLVFNLSVCDNENYFVTEDGVLVHNASY